MSRHLGVVGHEGIFQNYRGTSDMLSEAAVQTTQFKDYLRSIPTRHYRSYYHLSDPYRQIRPHSTCSHHLPEREATWMMGVSS